MFRLTARLLIWIVLFNCVDGEYINDDHMCSRNQTGLPACNFDRSLCSFNTYKDNASLKWLIGNYTTGGPLKYDWQPTLDKQHGSYMYLDFSDPHVPINASAVFSAQLPAEPDLSICIEFHYATAGNHNQDIEVYIQNYPAYSFGSTDILIGEIKNANTGGQWCTANLYTCIRGKRYIAFESFKTSANGSVAIDYINITRSYRNCNASFLSHQTVNVCPTMTTQAPSSTTLKSITCETIGTHGVSTDEMCTGNMTGLPSCNFDKSGCSYESHSNISLNWLRGNENTGGPFTSDWQPLTNPNGSYMYLNFSDPHVPINASAVFSAQLPAEPSLSICIEFHYATTGAYGQNIKVYGQTGQGFRSTNELLGEIKNANTGGHWCTANIYTCIGNKKFIIFESFKTSSDSAIGIEYIKISRSNRSCDESTSSSRVVTMSSTTTTPNKAVTDKVSTTGLTTATTAKPLTTVSIASTTTTLPSTTTRTTPSTTTTLPSTTTRTTPSTTTTTITTTTAKPTPGTATTKTTTPATTTIAKTTPSSTTTTKPTSPTTTTTKTTPSTTTTTETTASTTTTTETTASSTTNTKPTSPTTTATKTTPSTTTTAKTMPVTTTTTKTSPSTTTTAKTMPVTTTTTKTSPSTTTTKTTPSTTSTKTTPSTTTTTKTMPVTTPTTKTIPSTTKTRKTTPSTTTTIKTTPSTTTTKTTPLTTTTTPLTTTKEIKSSPTTVNPSTTTTEPLISQSSPVTGNLSEPTTEPKPTHLPSTNIFSSQFLLSSITTSLPATTGVKATTSLSRNTSLELPTPSITTNVTTVETRLTSPTLTTNLTLPTTRPSTSHRPITTSRPTTGLQTTDINNGKTDSQVSKGLSTTKTVVIAVFSTIAGILIIVALVVFFLRRQRSNATKNRTYITDDEVVVDGTAIKHASYPMSMLENTD